MRRASPSVASWASSDVAVWPFGRSTEGHSDAPERQVQVAALGDGDGVCQRVRLVVKDLRHLFGGLEVPVALHAHAFGVGHQAAGLDAEQDVVRVLVVRREVVDVVGGNQR